MTDKEILDLAQAELRAMYKRLGIKGSNVLTLIDEALRQPPVSGRLPNAEDVKRWYQLFVGESEIEMQKDIKATLC